MLHFNVSLLEFSDSCDIFTGSQHPTDVPATDVGQPARDNPDQGPGQDLSPDTRIVLGRAVDCLIDTLAHLCKAWIKKFFNLN